MLVDDACAFASIAHNGQFRKGTTRPYFCHPVKVARLVRMAGGDDEQIAAALLHDVVEDCGVSLDELARLFGARVAEIVAECSAVEGKGWREKKEKYLARHMSESAALVSLADKVNNAEDIVRDLRKGGAAVLGKFAGGRVGVLWYYKALIEKFSENGNPDLLFRLRVAVSLMEELAV